MNDFENKKQKILNELSITQQFINIYHITEMVEKLQPPKLTCSTCDYWIDEDRQITKTINFPHKTCNNKNMWENLRLGTTKECKHAWISPTDNFGCTHHSDYDGDKYE